MGLSLKTIVRSLAHRNFRLFFFGQTVSLIGSWMQQVAMSWLVFQMTNSSFLLGLVLFLGQIPLLFIPAFIGVLADRWDRQKALLVTQSLAMAQAFLLAALALGGWVQLWQIMALALFLGIVMSFDMPMRQSFLSEMVTDRDDFANAIAMNATMFNSARLIGPALAGLVLAHTSAGLCFLVNAISFLAVLWSLFAISVPPRVREVRAENVKADLKEGVRYVWRFAPIRNILLLLSVGSLTGSIATVVLPEYTSQVLRGDAAVLGWLGSAMGLGALTAALFLASRRSIVGLGEWIGGGIGIMGLGLAALPFAHHLWPGLAAFYVTGFGLVIHIASGNTVIQTIVDDDKRGRIMGFYTTAIVGIVPIGSLLSGFLCSALGLTGALVAMGGIGLVGSAVFLSYIPRFRAQVAPILLDLQLIQPAPVVEEI